MAQNENDWQKNQYRNRGERNFDPERNNEESDYYDRTGSNDWRRSDDDNYRSGNRGGSGQYNRSNEDSGNRRNEYGMNRGRYGNSTGVSRSGDNGDRGDYNQGNRRYSGSDYGYDSGNRQNRDSRDNDRDWWDKTTDEVSAWFGDEDAKRRRKMDEVTGQHKGKGPKGYTRSDDRIKEDINDRLSDDDNVDASDIDVTVNSGEVTLTGTVENRWVKRRAEDIADGVSGVKDVENRLKVSTGSNSASGRETGSNPDISSNSGTYGVPYGSSGAAPVGAFDTTKPE